jgi:hypothetical protein
VLHLLIHAVPIAIGLALKNALAPPLGERIGVGVRLRVFLPVLVAHPERHGVALHHGVLDAVEERQPVLVDVGERLIFGEQLLFAERHGVGVRDGVAVRVVLAHAVALRNGFDFADL